MSELLYTLVVPLATATEVILRCLLCPLQTQMPLLDRIPAANEVLSATPTLPDYVIVRCLVIVVLEA